MASSTLAEPCSAPLTSREQTITDLRQAAVLVREHGLCTGVFHDRLTGAYDPIGAIHEAVAPGFWSLDPEQVYMDPLRRKRCQAAVAALKRFLHLTGLSPLDYGAVARWTDVEGRTATQVGAALDGAAAAEALAR